MLLLWRRDEEGVEEEVIEWGPVAQTFLIRITPFRMSKGVIALLSALSFHGSSIYDCEANDS